MKINNKTYWRKSILTVLRIAVGWHFLYEGIYKLLMGNWSSYDYLINTRGLLSGFYHWIAGSPEVLRIVDVLNILGLFLIGLALFLGMFIRFASAAGVVLLTLYYFAYPPLGSLIYGLNSMHVFIVNGFFIEGIILLVFVFSRNNGYGIDSLIICKDYGIIPDYYMKTMHHDKYWSAHPRKKRVPFEVDGKKYLDHDRFHDNIFCLFPERSVQFVNEVKVPVMGFKVLAAGAIEPENGFKWAFKNGADFICVGMFDFQIVEDVKICVNILSEMKNRDRAWYG